MKVKEIMTGEARTCTPETSLAAAAMLMWEGDCGALPVIAEDRGVIGMITDRDICMADAMRPLPAAEIPVGEIITGKVFSCLPETDVRDALKLMQQERIHRLPVINKDGTLAGMLSMNDVVLEAKDTKSKKDVAPTYADAIETFKAICAHRRLPQTQVEPPQAKTATI